MAKRKRRRHPADRPAPPPSAAPRPRAEKKEAKRAARERERKRRARRSAGRRAVIGGVVGLLVFAAISWINRTQAPAAFGAAAEAARVAAGCSDIQTPAGSAPGNQHLEPGVDPGYVQHPATSGPHDADEWLTDQRVFTEPVDETIAVHTLEHGSVIVYYRAGGDGGPGQRVIDSLATVSNDSKATYLIPYPDLPEGISLAYTAWNKLLTCPTGINAEQATSIANGFVASFACTSNAPEGKLGDGC